MKTPGFRIGQAANLAHDWAMRDSGHNTDTKAFLTAWEERTGLYIKILNDMEKEFGDDEDWTDKKPEPKEIPVKLDFGDTQETN